MRMPTWTRVCVRSPMLLTLSSSAWVAPQASVASHKADSVDFHMAPECRGIDRCSVGMAEKERQEKGKETAGAGVVGGRSQVSETEEEAKMKSNECAKCGCWKGSADGSLVVVQNARSRPDSHKTLRITLAGLFSQQRQREMIGAWPALSYPCLGWWPRLRFLRLPPTFCISLISKLHAPQPGDFSHLQINNTVQHHPPFQTHTTSPPTAANPQPWTPTR